MFLLRVSKNQTKFILAALFLGAIHTSCRSSDQSQEEQSLQNTSSKTAVKSVSKTESENQAQTEKPVKSANKPEEKQSFFSRISSPIMGIFSPAEKKIMKIEKTKPKHIRLTFNSATGFDVKIKRMYGEKIRGSHRFTVLKFIDSQKLKSASKIGNVFLKEVETTVNRDFAKNHKNFLSHGKLNFSSLVTDSLEKTDNPNWKIDDQVLSLILCLPNPEQMPTNSVTANFKINALIAKAVYRPINAQGEAGKIRIFENRSLTASCQ